MKVFTRKNISVKEMDYFDDAYIFCMDRDSYLDVFRFETNLFAMV